jgi:AcrR family transcriptional regulator
VTSPSVGAFRHISVPRGRPRDTAVDRAVFDAAQELVVERGFSDLRLEHVAARAGVGKAAIYRRWASKEHLAFDLLRELAPSHVVDDVGDTLVELLSAVSSAIEAVTTTAFGALLRALLSDVVIQADLDDPYRERIEQGRRDAVAAVVRRAIVRGDLRDGSAEMAAELLIGPVYFRLLFGGDLDDAFANMLVDSFVRSFGRATDDDR